MSASSSRIKQWVEKMDYQLDHSFSFNSQKFDAKLWSEKKEANARAFWKNDLKFKSRKVSNRKFSQQVIEIKASKADNNDRLGTYSDGRENGSHYSQYVQSRLS